MYNRYWVVCGIKCGFEMKLFLYTEICPDCGRMESIEDWVACMKEVENIA